MNDLPNDLKSEIKLFSDEVKLLVRRLSWEIKQITLNKLSYWEDIWNEKFNVKYYIWIQKYYLTKRNEEYNRGVGFNKTFKAENHILSIVLRANGSISSIGWNFISQEPNVVLKRYKTLIRPHLEYCTQVKHGN